LSRYVFGQHGNDHREEGFAQTLQVLMKRNAIFLTKNAGKESVEEWMVSQLLSNVAFFF
jgi:hypothetical protein